MKKILIAVALIVCGTAGVVKALDKVEDLGRESAIEELDAQAAEAWAPAVAPIGCSFGGCETSSAHR